MKRSLWDVEVAITVANLEEGASKPTTIKVLLSDLSAFEYIRNLPLPEDDDVLAVDLVAAGLSPWPVCGRALACLVAITKPFTLSDTSDLEPHLRNAGTSLFPLLQAADALCLTSDARRGLDGPVKALLREEVTPLLLLQQESLLEEGGNSSYVQLSAPWDKITKEPQAGHMMHSSGACFSPGNVLARADVLLPVARWAALELYHLLDVLCLKGSMRALARLLVNPGKGLLWGDANWITLLKAQATSNRLSAVGRQVLFGAALTSGSKLPSAPLLHVGAVLPELSMREVVLHGKQVCQDTWISYHSESRLWLPLVLS